MMNLEYLAVLVIGEVYRRAGQQRLRDLGVR
jgi:hypothetical protein